MLSFFEKLISDYDLGSLQDEPKLISGGRNHQVYKITTNQNNYAVKCISQQSFDSNQKLQQCELIASQMAAQGIPALPALQINNQIIYEHNQQLALVYEWCDGSLLAIKDISTQQSKLIGTTLFNMHQTQLDTSNLTPTFKYDLASEHWKKYLSTPVFDALSQQLLTFMPMINKLTPLLNDAYFAMSCDYIVTHGDFDSFNVLWQNHDSFKIIDWELAGLFNPTMDVINTALYWSLESEKNISCSRFKTLIAAYRESGGELKHDVRLAFYAVIGYWLTWLDFNLHRCYFDQSTNNNLKDISKQEAIKTMHAIEYLCEHENDFLKNI